VSVTGGAEDNGSDEGQIMTALSGTSLSEICCNADSRMRPRERSSAVEFNPFGDLCKFLENSKSSAAFV